MRITSPDNPVVRRLRRLADSARACREAGRTLAEGLHVIEAALAAQVGDRHARHARQPIARRRRPGRTGAGDRPHRSSALNWARRFTTRISPVEHGVGVLAEITIPTA